MNKEKIVLISPSYPYRGGQALVEAHLYEKLTALGYDCYTISFKLLYPKIFFPGATQFDKSNQSFYNHESKVFRIINSINPFSWYLAIKKIKSLDPKLIIFVWWMPFFGPAYATIAFFIKRITKGKVSFLVENYISHENRWFDKIMSKITLQVSDTYICQSNYVKDQLEYHYINKPIFKTTLSVYDCYNNDIYDKISAKENLGIKTEKVVLFFGLIRKYKGLDQLIRSFKMIQEKYPDSTLLIVGECYEDINYYKDIITEEGIGNNVLLVDEFIDNEDIEPYFKASDVVCLPYNSATQSGILMMAYGFNIPVVVNNVGGLPELVVEGKTGHVIENNSPENIAKGIVNNLNNSGDTNYADNIKSLNKNLGYGNFGDLIKKLINYKN